MPASDGTAAGWRPGAMGAVLAAATLFATAAGGRPLQVEDLLQRETFGQVVIAPGERWLLVEQRGPFADAARFDFGRWNLLFRTRLMAADLARPGPLRPLFAPQAGTGYQAGPISPDGARAVVYRLTAEHWELGIARFATGEVMWTGLTPETPQLSRTVQWASPDTLLALVMAPGAQPWGLRAVRPQAALPALWAATAHGEAAVSAVGSGRHLAERPAAPPKRVMAISAATGAAEVLAEGDLVDLEISPSGRRLALLEAAEDIPLVAARPVHGPYGVAVRRLRLALLDLDSRRLTRPCPGCDMLASLLRWSPAGDALLAYARADGAPWTEGGLVRIDAEGRITRPGADLAAALDLRPERVAAGWLGRDPILFGRRRGAARDDWFRLTPKGAVPLTRALKAPPRDVVVADGGLLAAADDAAWRLDRDGGARRLTAAPFTPLPLRAEDIPERTQVGAVSDQALAGVLGRGDYALAQRFHGRGGPTAGHAATTDIANGTIPTGDGQVLALGRRGAVIDLVSGGGAERLVWRRAGAADVTLAEINRRLADVARPTPLAIAHLGPDGQRLVSWLYLPPPGAGPPPPLVVIPYPGRTYPDRPDPIWSDAPIAAAAALIGRGYAVLLPSLPSPRRNTGPADRLAERVLAIVDTAARPLDGIEPFDRTRMALWGHSFGGYAVTTLITQTDRFAAAVAVAPATDLVSRHGEFSPERRLDPDEGLSTPWSAGWVETLQGDMAVPPWEDPERYLRNSPLMGAGRIHTPLLLIAGEIDGSHMAQAEELFSALYRQDKDAILLTYWGEGHLFASPGNLRDYYRRAFDFLDQRLGPPAPGQRPAGAALDPKD